MLTCTTTTCSCATRQDAYLQHSKILMCNTTTCSCVTHAHVQHDKMLMCKTCSCATRQDAYVQHNKMLVCNTTRCLCVPHTICYVQRPPSAIGNTKKRSAHYATLGVCTAENPSVHQNAFLVSNAKRAHVSYSAQRQARFLIFLDAYGRNKALKNSRVPPSPSHTPPPPRYIRTGKARPRGIIYRNSNTSHYTSA